MENYNDNEAARILAADVRFTDGDFDRPSDILRLFKQWQRNEKKAVDEYDYPEFTGYYSTYLLQMWRGTSRQNAHYILRGDLKNGTMNGGVLEEVVETSRHQDVSLLPRHQQQEVRSYLEMQPLRDFPDLRGRVQLGRLAYDLYASVDRVSLTEADCEQNRVNDLLKLENDVYRIRHDAKK